MTAPWLAILVPSHDGEVWIADALGSVCAQEGLDGIECILIDSSATDSTLQAAAPFASRMALRMLHRPDLKPWQGKTNVAASMTEAPYVCMLHQDDLWLPGRATAARRWTEAWPETVLHLHPSVIIDEAGRHLGRWRSPFHADAAVPHDAFLERLLVQNFVAIPAPIIRRDAFLAVGGLDDGLWYTADWDLYLKLGQHGPVHYHSPALTAFRVHGGSLTVSGSRTLDEFAAQIRIVLDRYLDRVTDTRRSRVGRMADVSLCTNVALAAALHGRPWGLLSLAPVMLRLGPVGLATYLHQSRLFDRLLPRLRALLMGRLRRAEINSIRRCVRR